MANNVMDIVRKAVKTVKGLGKPTLAKIGTGVVLVIGGAALVLFGGKDDGEGSEIDTIEAGEEVGQDEIPTEMEERTIAEE